MNYHPIEHPSIASQGGFSLVELLVAMVLSLILIAATAQSYVSSKATYRNTTQVSELQSNVRFSSYFLSTEIKKAGNMGCFQDVTSVLQDNPNNAGLFDFSVPVQVWSFQGTEENTNYVIGTDTPVAVGVPRGRWRNKDGVRLPGRLMDRVVPGTDVIVFTSIGENLPVALEDSNKVADLDLEVNGTHTAQRGQLILVGDCQYADIFQHNGTSNARFSLNGTFNPGNNTFNSGWSKPWNSAHEVREINHFAYYIGVGTNGRPALMRMDLSRGLTGAQNRIEELVENAYNLQLILAEDRDADLFPDRLASPRNIDDLSNVVSIKLGLLHAGSNPSNVDDNPVQSFVLADSVTVTPFDKQLNYYTLDRTVKLQNKGIARGFAYDRK